VVKNLSLFLMVLRWQVVPGYLEHAMLAAKDIFKLVVFDNHPAALADRAAPVFKFV
jgi:hypothetical protein